MKMMKYAAVLLFAVVCACKTDDQARNSYRINELRQGMNKEQVTEKLGAPRRVEARRTADGRDQEILYYKTGTFDDTPVVLENGKVTGWGNAAAPR